MSTFWSRFFDIRNFPSLSETIFLMGIIIVPPLASNFVQWSLEPIFCALRTGAFCI